MWEKMETKTIVYDLDTSGGLMEVRVALLIPFPQRREGTSALRPTKPVLSSQHERARGGGFFLTQTLLPSLQFGEPSSASEDIYSSFTYSPPSICSPEAPTHSISLHRRASPPPSYRPLCASPSMSGYRASGLSRAWLWSPPLSIQGSGELGTAHPLPIPLP